MAARRTKKSSGASPGRPPRAPRTPGPQGREAPRAASKPATPAPAPKREASVVVGIGCSAGGLEALQQLFGHIGPESDQAFVVVQHLDPTREGSLVEILQRACPLPVSEVVDAEPVQGGRVYVIPRARDLAFTSGCFRLLPRPAERGARTTIDTFFTSLADDLGPRSVVLVLSGMGTDGTAGARAVRERAGVVLAQDPASAKFDAMPKGVIDAGLADAIGSPAELAEKLSGLTAAPGSARVGYRTAPAPHVPGGDAEALQSVIGLLRRATGNDFALYKPSTLARRVTRRAAAHQLDLPGYAVYLRDNPDEAELLFKELLIGVTSFFRDPDTWEQLEREVLPALLAVAVHDGVLRAWVPACSSGEEAYSLCIAFREALDRRRPARDVRLQVFATDLDASAIERARRGVYPQSIAREVSRERLARFFVEEDGGYRVRKEIRDAVVFAVHNAVQDPPFTKLDFVSCRNFLIYLNPELQRKLIPRLHYALKPGGFLFLGSSETVSGFAELFAPLGGSARLYRRLDAATRSALAAIDAPRSSIERPPPAQSFGDGGGAGGGSRLQPSVEQLLLRRFAPAAVLINPNGDVLYINGRMDAFLELPAGKANWNLLAMARDGLRRVLAPALKKAIASRKVVVVRDAKVERSGDVQVDVAVEPILETSLRGCVLVTFSSRASGGARSGRAPGPSPQPGRSVGAAGRLELQQARDDLQAMRREMQSSDEDLKAANEELQATNEELQSANEELTTSKEEMQSMNEELQTLNSELHAKLDELSRAGNDMKNLLDSTEIAILFLDDALHVRRYTPPATLIFKLIPGDVGRPLADLASNLDYPALYDDARDVLKRLASTERRVAAKDGRDYRMRIMPYRTSDNRIDGVVITFTSAHPESEVVAPPPPPRGKA